MKLQNIVTVVLVVLAVETQCGVIDNVFEKVKNTTLGLKQDVSNVVSYSKGFVGIENEEKKTEEQERGLIGGMIHSTKEKLHSVRNYFWNSDELSEDKGIFGNMFNRVKNHAIKIKGKILGEDDKPQITYTETKEAKLVRESLNKLFFSNGTRQVNGQAFQDAIKQLREEIHNRHFNKATTARPVNYGEGLLDVRGFPANIPKSIDDNTISINNDIYDKVDDDLAKANENIAKTYSNVKESINKGVNVAGDRMSGGLNELESKLADATAKENNLLSYNNKKLDEYVGSVGDDVKNL